MQQNLIRLHSCSGENSDVFSSVQLSYSDNADRSVIKLKFKCPRLSKPSTLLLKGWNACFYQRTMIIVSNLFFLNFSLLPEFQKIVLTKLVTLTDEVRKLQRSVPQSGVEIKKMDTLEEFQREEASLLKPHKFETLVRCFQRLMPNGVMRNTECLNRKTGLIISAFHFSTHLQR